MADGCAGASGRHQPPPCRHDAPGPSGSARAACAARPSSGNGARPAGSRPAGQLLSFGAHRLVSAGPCCQDLSHEHGAEADDGLPPVVLPEKAGGAGHHADGAHLYHLPFSLLRHHRQMRFFLALYRQRHAPLRRAAGKQAALRRDEAGPGILSHAARGILAKPCERRVFSHPDGRHGRERVFAHAGQDLSAPAGRDGVRRAGNAAAGPAARPRRVAGRLCAGRPDAERARLRGQARVADARHARLRTAQPRAAFQLFNPRAA